MRVLALITVLVPTIAFALIALAALVTERYTGFLLCGFMSILCSIPVFQVEKTDKEA